MANDAFHESPSRATEHPASSTRTPAPPRTPRSYRDDEGDNFDEEIDAEIEMERVAQSSARSFTPRSLVAGIIIGALITFSNTYFGLQTGWISTMAMPSALIGFSVFKVLSKHLSYPFTPVENVLIQTVAGAVGTMPLGCGFVGVIPAMEFLLRDGPDGPANDGGEGEGGPLRLGFWKLVLWSLGVCLFGVVFAVPLRKEVIVREKLKFPSGTASALMLRVLHRGGKTDEKAQGRVRYSVEDRQDEEEEVPVLSRASEEHGTPSRKDSSKDDSGGRRDWRSKMRLLIGAFTISGVYVSFCLWLQEPDTDCDRLSSLTLYLKSASFPFSELHLLRTGIGLLIHRRHILDKESSWDRQPVCTCSSGLHLAGGFCLQLQRTVAGLQDLWGTGKPEAKDGSYGSHWPSCLPTLSSVLGGLQ